jgi:hypothetical protein
MGVGKPAALLENKERESCDEVSKNHQPISPTIHPEGGFHPALRPVLSAGAGSNGSN